MMELEKTKHVVIGLGNAGRALYDLLDMVVPVVGYDVKESLVDKEQIEKYAELGVSFMHICIPHNDNFKEEIKNLFVKLEPRCIVIHSTVKPTTTKEIQDMYMVPVMYSPIRGVDERMRQDILKYPKFYAVNEIAPDATMWADEYEVVLNKIGISTIQMTDTTTLELAKILCDTTYYGWLISYAQLTHMIASRYGSSYDEMWTFADDIHNNLGNRPKMFPGVINGKAIRPNLELIDDPTLYFIRELDDTYREFVEAPQYDKV